MKKKLLGVLLVLAMVATCMIGCGKTDTPKDNGAAKSDDSGVKTVKVGFVFDGLDVNQTDHVYHIRYQLEKINEEQDIVKFEDFTAYNCNYDNQEFINNMETAVSSGYDVIMAMPVDNSGCLAAYADANKAGVKVIDLRGAANSPDAVNYQGLGEKPIGDCTTAYVEQYLNDHPDAVINVGLVYPPAAATGSYCRVEGIKDLAEKYPDQVNILVDGYGDWATDTAQSLVEDWIQTYSDLNFIVCANDEEALGAANAVEAANLKDKIMICGANGGEQGALLVKEGHIDATACQDKTVFAGNLAKFCVALFDGSYTGLDGWDAEASSYNPPLESCYELTPDNVEARLEELEQFKSIFAEYK